MSALGRVLVPAAVLTVFALARRYMPAAVDEPYSEEEALHFSRLQWAVGATIVVVGVSFGLASYEGLLWANRTLAFPSANSRFVLLPSRSLWLFLPLFGGASLAWELTYQLWKVLGDSCKAEKYASWSNAKTGFNATGLLRLLLIGVALPVAIASFLALPIHTTFTDSGISIGRFGTVRVTHHNLQDVREITITDGLRARDGSLTERPAIVLTFADGTRWSSADDRDIEKTIDRSLLEFLQQKTNLPVHHIEAFPFGAV